MTIHQNLRSIGLGKMPLVSTSAETLFKSRLQPESRNAAPGGSAAFLAGGRATRMAFPVSDWERDKQDNRPLA